MLHSDWLLKMLDKTARTPRERVLTLFDILQDWTAAPGLKPGNTHAEASGTADALLGYLTRQLTTLQLETPDSLAVQIYFLALGALQTAETGDRTQAFTQARHAAEILLNAQRRPRRLPLGVAAMAASVFLLVSALWIPAHHHPAILTGNTNTPPTPADLKSAALTQADISTSPDQVAALHASLERIRHGVCQYPQALMLAPEARAVLLENVVHGSVPADVGQMHATRLLIQKVECYYPPVAMTAL